MRMNSNVKYIFFNILWLIHKIEHYPKIEKKIDFTIDLNFKGK
jgi:hypothetical protein